MTNDPKCKYCGVLKSVHHICASCVCSSCPQRSDGMDECYHGFEAETTPASASDRK